jgi:hypothetical protein
VSARLAWYVNRLRCMSAAEVLHRVRQAATLQWRARTAARPQDAPPPDMDGAAPAWCAGDLRPQHVAPLCRAADALVQGRLPVLGLGEVDIGHSPDWRRCPKTGVQAPLQFGPLMALGDRKLVGDIKYLWEPSRHNALVLLAQAWRATRDPRYLDTFAQWLDGWIAQNPHPLGPHWASSLEGGIRLINWSLAWQLLDAAPPGGELDRRHPGLRERWLAAVYWHLHFVRGHLSAHSSANNHLVGELAGLYIGLATWPRWRRCAAWRDDIRRRLQHEALQQNAPDGVNREQASSYQGFVLEFLLLASRCAQAGGEPFADAVGERLHAMARFIAVLMDAGGHLPQIGDADDGLACGLWTDAADNAASLLAIAALRFDDPALAQAGAEADAKAVALLGASAAERWDTLRRRGASLVLPQVFRDGGYAVLGSHAGTAQEVRVVFDVGPLGYLGIAAHGHADALSVQLSAGGQPLLVDPGTFAYHGPIEWREHFRSTAAHNTVEIGGRSQSVSGGRFMWVGHADARLVEHGTGADGVQRCVGQLDAYAGNGTLRHRRTLRWDPAAQRLEVIDEIEGEGTHDIALHWQLAPGLQAQAEGPVLRVRGGARELGLHGPEGWPLVLVQAREGDPRAWVSTRYDTKRAATQLRFARQAVALPVRLVTQIVIAPPAPPPDRGAVAAGTAGIISIGSP